MQVCIFGMLPFFALGSSGVNLNTSTVFPQILLHTQNAIPRAPLVLLLLIILSTHAACYGLNCTVIIDPVY